MGQGQDNGTTWPIKRDKIGTVSKENIEIIVNLKLNNWKIILKNGTGTMQWDSIGTAYFLKVSHSEVLKILAFKDIGTIGTIKQYK